MFAFWGLTYKTSLKADKEVGGAGGGRGQSAPLGPGGKAGTIRAVGTRRATPLKLKAGPSGTGTAGPARTDGGRDGRTDTHKSLRPTLATEESSRARSFARSHARTQRKRKRNRNRFPGSGVGLKSLSHPQPPISFMTYESCRYYILYL